MIRLVCILIGYVFGLFQTAYIIGRMNGIDIRDHGSGNSGTTNMMRTLGRKAGILTFLGDCLKCILAIVLVRVLFAGRYADMVPLLSLYAGAGCILGHNFPFYLHFRGGKGIACTAGLIIAFNPVMLLLGIVIFFGTVLLTNYVSLGSLLVYVGIIIELPVLGQRGAFGMAQPLLNEMYIVGVILAALAFFMHRGNIGRLIRGEERKSYLLGKKKNK